MYKPAKIREFVTPALHKKPTEKTINGRTIKTYVNAPKPNLKGKFKLKGTSEITANGLTVVNDKTSYTTWYKSDFEAKDILTINGTDYLIIGTPENVEMRGRYSILNLEKIEGGA
jgi:hypothetical protein